MRTVAAAFTLTLALALASRPARGNGRFPEAQHVTVGAGRIALRTTFGFLVSDDNGATFHWVCEEALQYGGVAFDPAFVLDAMGRLQLGLTDGLLHASVDHCGSTRIPVLEGEFVADLDSDRAGRVVVAVTSSGLAADGGAARNGVYRSDDGGESFARLGDAPPGTLFETLELAPANTQRIYLTAVRNDPRRVLLFRSDDGGATLRELPFAPASGLRSAFIAGVDPTNADVVYLRGLIDAPADDAGNITAATALLKSTDAGATWREIARSLGPMRGFALADDGRTVWYGGPDPRDGLERSDDGGASFHRIGAPQVLCLRYRDGALYVCGNFVTDGYALGSSRDRGEHIAPLLRLCDVGGAFPGCAPASLESSICAERWALVRANFGCTEPAPDAGALDAQRAPPPSFALRGGSCRCSAPGALSEGNTAAALRSIALLAALGGARRARRRSS